METARTQRAVRASQLASGAAALAVAVGTLVLLGWTFDIAVLKSIWPGWVAMKANTAVSFILLGIALWLIARPATTFKPERSGHSINLLSQALQQHPFLFSRFARLCALLACLIGLFSLGEYIFNWNPGIDRPEMDDYDLTSASRPLSGFPTGILPFGENRKK